MGELVDTDLLRQRRLRPFQYATGAGLRWCLVIVAHSGSRPTPVGAGFDHSVADRCLLVGADRPAPGPLEAPPSQRLLDTDQRRPAEPRAAPDTAASHHDTALGVVTNPDELTGRPHGPAADAGTERGYEVLPASASSPGVPPAASPDAPGSAPWDHSAAETASPPSAGCQTISPASFWTHSPSAHSSPA